MPIYYVDKKYPEIVDAKEKNTLVIIPIGMIEEHGHHLPISTDTIIADEIAKLTAKRIQDEIPVLVLPPVWTGFHNKPVSDYPGALSLRPETLIDLVYDICASLCKDGFKKIFLLNGHGQNPPVLEIVCRKITDDFGVNMLMASTWKLIGKEGAKIRKSKVGGCGGHGDEVETSLMLAINKNLVDMTKAYDESCNYSNQFIAGDIWPEHETFGGVYWSAWAVQKTKTGLLGDASVATEETGRKFLELIVGNCCDLLRLYYK